MRSGCTVSQVTGYMLIIVISLLYWKTRRVGEKGHNTGNSGDFNMKTEHELQRKRSLKTKNADSPSRKNYKKRALQLLMSWKALSVPIIFSVLFQVEDIHMIREMCFYPLLGALTIRQCRIYMRGAGHFHRRRATQVA